MKKKLGLIDNDKITILREMTDNEYLEYENNLKVLLSFSNKQQLFTILDLNFEDLKNALDNYLIEFKSNPSMNWVRMEKMIMNINRLLLNFLSAFRTLLDHMEYTLKKNYGNESENFTRFKNLCSEQYDLYFSYRFLYKLRNYAQHCGMPVGSLTIESKAISIESKEVEDYLAIYFERDVLLSNYDSWGSIKNELNNMPLKFEITPFVDEVMECISRINLLVIEHDLEDVFKSTEYFENLLKPFTGIKETPAIFDIVDKNGDGKKLNVKVEWLPLHLIDIVQKVKKSTI